MLTFDFGTLSDNIAYLVFFISKIIKRIWIQFLILFLFFIADKLYKNYFSNNAYNKEFERYYTTIATDKPILYNILKYQFNNFIGDTIIPAQFFTEIAENNLLVYKNQQYTNDIKFIRIIINERPSTSLQLSFDNDGDGIKNNLIILNNINSKDKNERFILERKRAKLFLKDNPNTKTISIYYNEPINKYNLEINLKQFPNQIILKKVIQEQIQDNWKGQIIIIKLLKTKSYLIFREGNGEQSHRLLNSKKEKRLFYYGIITNLEQLKYIDNNFYNCLDIFNLLKKISEYN
jgi:hypothetical protein